MANYFTQSAYVWDDAAKTGYLSYPAGKGPGGATFISYEDPKSIAAKGAFVKDQNLGGTIVWTLAEGCTDPATGANPPLDAVKAAFMQ
jgi:chitinase